MSGNLGTIYYEVDARTGKLLAAQQQADEAFDRIERGARKADSGVKKLNTQMTKTSAAVKTNLSPAIRNASFQIADLATQLQMGGNALQAFAVQGAQLLAGFGTMGAVAGAVLAIAGAIGNSLTDSMDDATDSAERMKEALSSIDAVIGKSTQGVNAFSDSYYEATQNNAIAAAVMKEQAVRALKTLQEETREAGRAITEFSNAGWMKGGDLGTVARELDALGVSGNSLNEVLKKLSKEGAFGAVLGKQLTAVIEGLGDKYSVTEGEAMALYNAMAQFRKNPSSYEAQSLLSILKAMEPTTAAGRAELEKYIDALLRYSNEALTAEERQRALNEALNAGASAAAIATGEMMVKQLQVKQEQLKGNANADVDLALKEGKLTKAHHEEIVKLREQNKTLEENKRKEEEKAREKERAAKQAESAAKQAQRELEQLQKRGQGVADKYNVEDAAQRKLKEDQEALNAAMEAGKISTEQYNAAWAGLLRTEAQRKQQAGWDNLVSQEDKLKGRVDPIQQVMNEWNVRKQMMLDLGVTEATMRQAEIDHKERILNLQWQQWQAQSDTNALVGNMIDGLASGAGGAFTGLLNGSQSFQESLANIGTTIINQVVGSLAQMGAEYVKQLVMGEVAQKSASASATATAAATGASIASSMAPAAAATATATMGTAPMVAMSAMSALMTGITSLFGGRRYNGGAVNGGNLYRVGENKVPELFQTNNGRQYMIPGENGRIIPGRDIGGAGGVTINSPITINTTNGFSDEDSRRLEEAMKRVAMGVCRQESTRPGGMLAPRRR
ncbi:phage tail length tape measure family protein [Escherichia coli]|nr:phage tail length tape measure family protein [Escherichia coli]